MNTLARENDDVRPLKIGRRLRCLALLGSTCLTMPVVAQTAVTVAPEPEHWAQDARRVDRVTGQITWLSTDLQIGPAGPGGLTLVSLHSPSQAYGSLAGTNWENMTIITSGTQVTVGIGTSSVSFNKSGTTYTPAQANGAVLTQSGTSYTYVDASGLKINFNVPAPANNRYTGVVARAGSVIYPSGETVTLTWRSSNYCGGGNTNGVNAQPAATAATPAAGNTCLTYVRLTSVASSQGYQLHYRYVADAVDNSDDWSTVASVSAINLGQSYCDPAALTCSTSVASVGYARSYGQSGAQTVTVTDPIGRQSAFTVQPGQFAIRTPIASSPDIVYTVTTDPNPVVTGVAWRGVSYAYSQSVSGSQRTIVSTVSGTSSSETTVADTSIARILSYTDALSRQTTYGYTNGDLTSVQTPFGTKAVYTRDARGNVTQSSYFAAGASSESYHTSQAYPGCASGVTCNLPTSSTDANGNTTIYGYDQTYGSLVEVTGPSVTGGQSDTRYKYTPLQAYYLNSSGQIVASGVPVNKLTGTSLCRSSTASCINTSDENRTTIAYGQTGVANNLLPTSTTVAAGDNSVSATTTTSYNAAGDATSIVGPLGSAYTTVKRYDAAHQLVGIVGPDSDGPGGKANPAIRYSYNGDGNVSQVEQGTAPSQADSDWPNFSSHRQIVTSYDGNGRRSSVALTAGGTTYSFEQLSYDSHGRLDCDTVRMNMATVGSEPGACSLGTAGSYGNDRIARQEYDAADQVTKLWTGYATSLASNTQYGYTANGDLGSVIDQAGNKTTYVYDTLARLYQIQYPNSTVGSGSSNSNDYEQFGYDNDGNVTSRKLRGTSTAASISYGYDAMSRMTSKTLPSGGTNPNATYGYDLASNLLTANTIIPSNGHQTGTSLGYDALGRRTYETLSLDGANSRQKTFGYDASGRLTSLAWWDGVYVRYDYDNDDQMTGIRENGSTVIASYSYDDDGRRTARSYANGTSTTYGYDAVSRLTSLTLNGAQATSVTLGSYNPAGQIGTRTNSNDAYAWTAGANANRAYATNGLNQYTTINGIAQSQDPKGNMTSGPSTALTYNAENNVGTGAGGSFYYDGLNRLAYDANTPGTRSDYMRAIMTTEMNANGDIVRRYVPGPRADETVLWYEGAGTGTKRYLDQDERGSVIRITDSGGALIGVNSYDEYGVPGASNQGRFGFTGQAWIGELSLDYYKARVYSPQLGRFLQTDPLHGANGDNWYSYVHDDPANATDPTGLAVNIDIDVSSLEFTKQDGIEHDQEVGSDSDEIVVTAPNKGGIVISAPPINFDLSSFRISLASIGSGRSSLAPQRRPSSSRSCLRNIDPDTLAGLGLDAVGLAASATGLKAAWTAGSAAVGATTAVLALTASAFTAENRDQAVALGGAAVATGGPLIPEGTSAASKAIASSVPGVGVAVSGGILVYDGLNALKKAGCF